MSIHFPGKKRNNFRTKEKIIPQTINYNNLSDFFDKIFVISLENDISQQEIISKYFKNHGIVFEFFYGINGFNNQECQNLYKQYCEWNFDDIKSHPIEQKYKRKLIASPGAFGLLKTYENIFEHSINNKYKNILIFEDDVLFDKDFHKKALSFVNHIQTINEYSMIYFGASHHVWNNPYMMNVSNTDIRYYEAPYCIDGSFAIAYNHSTFSEILTEIKNYNGPIDLCIRNINTKHKSYVIYPNIAIAETTRPSLITNQSRNLRHHCNNVKWQLSNIDFTRGTLKVSIIIANYNSENTIFYTLESIKNQTYLNIETIIVDDNSNDGSKNIIKQWISNHKDINIKLIELDNNIGAYKARNIGLKNSTGFFITLLDSDDIFLPNKIQNDIYNYFNHPNCDVFFSLMYRSSNIESKYFNDYDKLLLEINHERQVNKIYNNDNEYDYPWQYKFRFGMPTIFLEKTFFDNYGFWREDFRYGMDIELIQRYIVKKYQQFISHQDLFNLIYSDFYASNNYGIFCDQKMQYISFPMNQNNATNTCFYEERKHIHDICNRDLIFTLSTHKEGHSNALERN